MVRPVRPRADAQVIQDRDTGRSKGFGFVEMDTDAQAHAAILGLNDLEHEGRWLMVSEAKPRVARTSPVAAAIDGMVALAAAAVMAVLAASIDRPPCRRRSSEPGIRPSVVSFTEPSTKSKSNHQSWFGA